MNEQEQLILWDRITDLEELLDEAFYDLNKSMIVIMVALAVILALLLVRA